MFPDNFRTLMFPDRLRTVLGQNVAVGNSKIFRADKELDRLKLFKTVYVLMCDSL